MMRRAERRGQLDRFVNIFQHRTMPSRVVIPERLLAGTASLLVRPGCDRRAVLRETGDLIVANVRREWLRRSPVFVDSVTHADARETEVAPARVAA